MTNENTTELKPWPMDFDTLQKGDVIPVADVERMTGKKQGTDEYKFAVMNIIDRMRDHMKRKELFWTVVSRKSAICVLTDPEAAEHNPNEYEKSRKRLKRLHVQTLAVDTMQLSDEQRDTHYRRLQVQAFEMSAMRSARLECIKSAKQICKDA
jgi:cytochrome P450